MRKIAPFAAAFAAIAVCASALAQTPQFPTPQQSPPQPQIPAPTVRTQVPLRPLPQQSAVPVAEFSTGDLRCAPNLQSATMLVNALLTVAPNPVTGNRAQVDMLVDGVSLGSETLRIENGAVRVGRRATLAGASGEHQVVYVVDGAARSAPTSFAHQCIRQAPIRAPAPGHLTLPNLAFGDLLYTQLTPSTRRTGPSGVARNITEANITEPRVSLGHRWSFGSPIIARDIQTLTGVIQFPSNDICPKPQDAYVTAQFAIAVRITRVANPAEHVSVAAGPFETPAFFVDTMDQPRWATGEALGSDDRLSGTPLPQGYQWIVVSPGLACTRDGVLEIRFDPDNRLRESNEGDNVLRLRYSTVP